MRTPYTAVAVRTFGIILVLVGFVPVVLFALGSLVPSADVGVFPDPSWLRSAQSWLYARKIWWAPSAGLIFALPGLIAMYVGALIARRQEPLFDAATARTHDARRRIRQYASERIEPTLGPD